MVTAEHTVTTTAYTASGFVPICHCGWTPSAALATPDDVEFALYVHNNAFTLEVCPRCARELQTVERYFKVRAESDHFADKQCAMCGWKASTFSD